MKEVNLKKIKHIFEKKGHNAPYPKLISKNHVFKVAFWVTKLIKSSDVRPNDKSCLRELLKLFLVYLILSLLFVSIEAKSLGFQT